MSQDLSNTLRTLADTAVRHAQGRLKLLQLEIGEERERLVEILQRGVLAAFAALATLHLMLFSLIALTWNTPLRYPVLVFLLLVMSAVTILAFRRYLVAIGSVSMLFKLSLGELEKDRSALDE